MMPPRKSDLPKIIAEQNFAESEQAARRNQPQNINLKTKQRDESQSAEREREKINCTILKNHSRAERKRER